MSTNHHDPLAFGGALTSAAMEAPLGQLDAAIDTVITTGSGASTSLTAQANAASTGPFSVGSTAGILPGDVVFFGEAGGTNESRIVATVPGGGLTFTVTVALTNTYAIGKPVSKSPIEIVGARGAFGTLGAHLTDINADIAAEIARAIAAEAAITAAQAFVGCKAYHSTTQSVVTATVTAAALNSEEWDTSAFHDLVTNNSRLTIPAGKAGKYLLTAGAPFSTSSAVGYRLLTILLNGARTVRGDSNQIPGTAPATTVVQITTILDLIVGDYVELGLYQNSGGNLNVGSASATEQTFLALAKL